MVLTERQMKIISKITSDNVRDFAEKHPWPTAAAIAAAATAREAERVKLMIGSGAGFEDILCEILGVP